MVYILARVIAGAAHMLHGHLEFLGRQLFPDLSESEYLIRQASLYEMVKTSPDFAHVTVELTGDDGTIIPEGTILVSAEGLEYETDGDVTIASGTADCDITAVLAGADGSLLEGVVLSLQSPIAGCDSTTEVTDVIADGADEETTEALRTRLLARIAEPPMGGNDADYVAWAKLVAGVTRAWVTRLGLGPGTVLVRFVRDDDASPIPDSGEVAAVQAVFDEYAPAHATVTAFAPVAAPLNFEINLVPSTVATQAAVEAELEDLLLREGEPGGTILLSAIQTAIGNATGVTDYSVTLPAADVTHTANQLPTMGTVTY